MKLTKNCLYPWAFLQVHAGGMMQCCAVGNDADLGDFIIDHCQKESRGEFSDVLNSPGLVRLRESLLSGNLRPMCRRCFFADDRLVTTEALEARVKGHLKKRLPANTDVNTLDLTRSYAYNEMAISFTNRCNLSCVYCIQSTQSKSNPYFKMEFPEEYASSTLDFFASQGIRQIRSCVEGEPTIYKKWYEVFSGFKKKYPQIELYMTTNLSRNYTEQEIELMARYKVLDVSCDTLDPILYAKLRRHGNLSLVLKNIERVQKKIQELKIKGPRISMHTVVSDLTWPTLQEFADYAFSHGCVPLLGNYEERSNAISYQQQICRPLTSMCEEEQIKAQACIVSIKNKIEERGYDSREFIQGGLLYNIEKQISHNFNRFTPYDNNPLHALFYAKYPFGHKNMHLDIVYDYDNIAYNGVLFNRPAQLLCLDGFNYTHVVIREVFIYKAGHHSHKYGQVVLPGYRKTITLNNGVLNYTPIFSEDIEQILLEVSEYW